MTKIKMALALDKLIKDVKEEKILWNDNYSRTNDEEENAWNRVASKNMLTGGEAKSIFKVLCKKYRQEAQKPITSWQLFEALKFLDNKNEDTPIKNEIPEQSIPSPISNHEEETFVELLEVKEEDFSEDDEDNEDMEMNEKSPNNSNSSNKKVAVTTKRTPPTNKNKTTAGEKKATNVTHLINNDLNQKIMMKDSIEKQNASIDKEKSNNHSNDTVKEKIQNALPPSITIKKEKENNNTSSSTSSSTTSTTSVLNSLKRKYPSPSSETNNHSHQSHNGSSNSSHNQKDSDLDHGHVEKRRVIKMPITENSEENNTHKQQQQQKHHHHQKHKSQQQQQHRRSLQEFIKNDLKSMSAEASNTISNLTSDTAALNAINNVANTVTTNVDDDEHRKFIHFGNYVATTMNRLTPKLAAKLEIKILQAIIDVNSEMINRF